MVGTGLKLEVEFEYKHCYQKLNDNFIQMFLVLMTFIGYYTNVPCIHDIHRLL